MSNATHTSAPDATCRELATFAHGLKFDDIPNDVVHEATRRIIDTLGCGYGGYHNESARIAREISSEYSGRTEAHVLGASGRTTPELAAFANAVMIRYQDLNDVNKGLRAGGHPSDVIPAILSVADAHRLSGAEALRGVVVAYQGFGAIPVHVKKRGWDQGIMVATGVAMGVGAMLQLTVEQLEDAISLALVPNLPLCVTRRGELSMWKSCASAAANRSAIFATLLAAKGLTGPSKPIEGVHGLIEQATGPFSLELDPKAHGFRVTQSDIKRFPACGSTQAVIATLIHMTRDLSADDVESIDVATHWDTWFETGREPEKWDPQSRETADHSLPYVMATALRQGDVTLDSFTDDAISDPSLRPLMSRIRISEDPDLTALRPAQTLSDIVITTRAGERLEQRTGIPLGDHRNPVSDEQLEQKFRGMAEPIVNHGEVDDVLAALWNLESETDCEETMRLWATSVHPNVTPGAARILTTKPRARLKIEG